MDRLGDSMSDVVEVSRSKLRAIQYIVLRKSPTDAKGTYGSVALEIPIILLIPDEKVPLRLASTPAEEGESTRRY